MSIKILLAVEHNHFSITEVTRFLTPVRICTHFRHSVKYYAGARFGSVQSVREIE
jgi:hypothetical protein